MDILGTLRDLALESGFAAFFVTAGGWKNIIMILITFCKNKSCFFSFINNS